MTDSEVGKYPWQSETEFYDIHGEEIFSNHRFYHVGLIGNSDKDFLDYILRRLKPASDSVVVDLGCGSGYVAGQLARFCTAIGISTSSVCVEGCRRRYPHAQFVQANMEQYVHEGATHVVAMESLGYADAGKALECIGKSLRPGGMLFIKDLFRHGFETSEQAANRLHWEEYWNYSGRHVPDFIQLACSKGFELKEFRDVSSFINPAVFRETLAYNRYAYSLPFPNVQDYVISVEFVFIRRA